MDAVVRPVRADEMHDAMRNNRIRASSRVERSTSILARSRSIRRDATHARDSARIYLYALISRAASCVAFGRFKFQIDAKKRSERDDAGSIARRSCRSHLR